MEATVALGAIAAVYEPPNVGAAAVDAEEAAIENAGAGTKPDAAGGLNSTGRSEEAKGFQLELSAAGALDVDAKVPKVGADGGAAVAECVAKTFDEAAAEKIVPAFGFGRDRGFLERLVRSA